MSTKIVVHASKIPEPLQVRSKDTRMLAGDLVYVNACDDRPWTKVPLDTPLSEAVVCAACLYVVELNRQMRV